MTMQISTFDLFDERTRGGQNYCKMRKILKYLKKLKNLNLNK